jgi:hypothetical protein
VKAGDDRNRDDVRNSFGERARLLGRTRDLLGNVELAGDREERDLQPETSRGRECCVSLDG